MNAIISQRIMNEIKNGKSINEAVDSVLGAGTYARIASDLYDTLTK